MVAPPNLNDVIRLEGNTIDVLLGLFAVNRDPERLKLGLGEVCQPEIG